MASSWPNTTDTGLQIVAGDFSAKITAAPTTYGLVAGDATTLASLVTTYNSSLAAATDPATRTKVTVVSKDVAKAQLLADLRILAKRIQANPAVTPAQKTTLGLPIHKTTPTPIDAPVTKPLLNVVSILPAAMALRAADETTPNKRAKPYGATGMEVYSAAVATGATPPADMSQWTFQGVVTKADFSISFNPADGGKQAYIAARWISAKGEAGPYSLPTVAPIAA